MLHKGRIELQQLAYQDLRIKSDRPLTGRKRPRLLRGAGK